MTTNAELPDTVRRFWDYAQKHRCNPAPVFAVVNAHGYCFGWSVHQTSAERDLSRRDQSYTGPLRIEKWKPEDAK